MSIFRETFPQFIQTELNRRQKEMATRTPAFLQQLNTRNAWVRMTSGVNTLNASGTYNNNLASNYVLQGGTLLNNTSLRSGLGGSGISSYDIKSPGGVKHRLGIRPMPGITGVSIQSKGAYGSLQEATVSFNCWDIKQLEDLELLYMRPGYTVLFEFGWDFAKNYFGGALPKYDILNAQEGLTLNKAFADIYTKIEQSNGTYDALLGYVKNYNWSARDDGGYDCTTTIISLGEVLESLKCNWVPLETSAFDVSGSGLLKQNSPAEVPGIIQSYEQGIIPGLLHELWDYMDRKVIPANGARNYSRTFNDPTFGTPYYLYMSKQMSAEAKNDRGGLVKPLGTEVPTEGWITLGSFCDLINNYVLIKSGKDNPLSKIITYETDTKGNILKEDYQGQLLPKSLKCIASPLAISTNLGVCLVRNDRWATLSAEVAKNEEVVDKNSTTPLPEKTVPSDIQTAINNKNFKAINRFIIKTPVVADGKSVYAYYNGDLEKDIIDFANELQSSIVDAIVKDGNIRIILPGENNNFTLKSQNSLTLTSLNWFDYFYPSEILVVPVPTVGPITLDVGKNTLDERANAAFKDLFKNIFATTEVGINDEKGKSYTKKEIIPLLKQYLGTASIDSKIQELIKIKIPDVAQNVANEAANTPGISGGTLLFLYPDNSLDLKTVGRISNIYVNINYLYSQAISKNVASNDTQNTNNISIREYLQSILRDIQNSLGNINDFDIQIDNRTAIGRIVDLNFTANPSEFTGEKSLFQLKIHNTNSVVRNYGFQSKIFPEMGAIIAISAQDPSGIGKLGYDNATLVAWNEGVRDRLIPKKDFSPEIQISKGDDPASFILPFLTKMVQYFNVLQGQDKANINYAYGGLDFAYRDFLANLNRFDERNNFKTIIPTELNITLDGIGGIVIGNLFTINQEIVPKGYRNTPGRSLAYIVTKLGHSISDNDWTTDLGAYPVVFENALGTNVAKKWKNQQYPGSINLKLGSTVLANFSRKDTKGFNQNNIKTAMNFFINKGFSVEATAALVGGFLQESGLNPSTINPIGALGIAQWLGDRKNQLLKKQNSTSLQTQLDYVYEELNGNEKGAGRKLKNSTTFEEAVAAAASYERFAGITKGVNTTYQDVLFAEETGNRISWAADLVNRYKAGEFK
jgi:hypothetical protein